MSAGSSSVPAGPTAAFSRSITSGGTGLATRISVTSGALALQEPAQLRLEDLAVVVIGRRVERPGWLRADSCHRPTGAASSPGDDHHLGRKRARLGIRTETFASRRRCRRMSIPIARRATKCSRRLTPPPQLVTVYHACA